MSERNSIIQAAFEAQQEFNLFEAKCDPRYMDIGKTSRMNELLDRMHTAQEAAGGKVFRIPDFNLPYLQESIAKLNKAATKLGCEPIEIETVPAERLERKGEIIERLYVVVHGRAPKLAGWRFVATLEHDEGDVIIRRLPTFEGEADLSAYRNASPEHCDHCGFKRYRKDTYVVQHEDGTLKQVGSNCLADFLGHQNPQAIARFCEMIAYLMDDFSEAEEDYEGSNGPRPERRFDTPFFMTHVACMIREHGWVSKTAARNSDQHATAEFAEQNMFNQIKRITDRQGAQMWIDPTEEDQALAVQAIEWVRDLTEDEIRPTERSDYLYNLYTVLKKDSIRERQMGIAASGIAAYQRKLEQEIKRANDEKNGKVEAFIGEIKERRVFRFTVERIFSYEGDGYYSDVYYKHIMRDESGATLVWNGSRSLEQGKSYEGKFTVKKHDDGKYGKQTQITRPGKDLKEIAC